MLITSTSNKAVENVYCDLKSMFKEGFCYIGGNYTNRKLSAEEIGNYIEYLRTTSYREGSMEDIESKIKKAVTILENSKEKYERIKKQLKEDFGIEKIEEISVITGSKYSVNEILSFVEEKDSIKIINTAKKLSKIGFFLDIFGLDKFIYKKMKLDNSDFYIEDKDSFIHMAECLQTIKKYKKEIKKHIKIIEEERKKEAIEKIDKKYIEEILKTDNFGEYFREKHHKLNFDLFFLQTKLE